MGLTSDGLSVESVANILRVMVVLIKSAELPAYPVETVLASYMYRLGESKTAYDLLSNGLDKDYSLAKLLARVFIGGWPADSFATMANELHNKVCDELTRTQELMVNEANRVYIVGANVRTNVFTIGLASCRGLYPRWRGDMANGGGYLLALLQGKENRLLTS
jgi:hypothetical protein